LPGHAEDVTDFCHAGDFALHPSRLTLDIGNSYSSMTRRPTVAANPGGLRPLPYFNKLYEK
jgi:hypothetical protein